MIYALLTMRAFLQAEDKGTHEQGPKDNGNITFTTTVWARRHASSARARRQPMGGQSGREVIKAAHVARVGDSRCCSR